MPTPIEVTAEPVDQDRCKFILSRAVHEPGVKKYTSVEDAAESPVAEAVMEVSGISEVVVSGNVITAAKSDPDMPWSVLEPQIRYAVNAGAERLEASAASVGGAMDDDAIYDAVAEIFETQINPAVAQHGGRIDLIDVQDATIIVRLMGGCQGCGMANVTLRQGVEAAVKRLVPAVKGVRDITDHSSGSNPYFQQGSK
ncbi:MAG: NifU family protein [Gemmatimonadota bacterium]|nr:MAG: NifU family protein [Gemmatimonadota bacterium]